jgi:hypothetical protein
MLIGLDVGQPFRGPSPHRMKRFIPSRTPVRMP